MFQDLGYATRMLRRTPGFTAVALLALALGIGANTAVFTVVNAVFLQPLKFDHSEQLAVMRSRNPTMGLRELPLSPPDFLDYRAQNQVFSHMSVVRAEPFSYVGESEAQRLRGALVSTDFFDLMGARPALGRGFLTEEDQPGRNQVVVLSDGLWQREFGGRPDILGRSIQLGGKPYIVVGVASRDFNFPRRTELWSPFAFGPQELRSRALRYVGVVGRLKPDVSMDQAREEMNTIAARLEKQYPAEDKGWGALLRGLQEDMVGSVRPAMLTLLAAAGFVLLIACANLANLLLARSGVRQREISVRAALGAGNGRLIRQLLTESVLLSMAGAGLGLWLADAGTRLVARTGANILPRAGDIAMNGRVLGFTVAIAVLTGLLFGLAPALKLARRDIHSGLREAGGGAYAGFRRNRLRSALVIVEVALSLALLTGAGLLMRSFYQLQSVDPGFQPQNLLAIRVALPEIRYSRPEQRLAFFERVLERIRSLPGVQAAGATTDFPLDTGSTLAYLFVPGQPPKPHGHEDTATSHFVTPGYFESMKIQLKTGRFFDERDGPDSQRVSIISDALAKQFFRSENPIGKLIVFGGPQGKPSTIVGVASDVRQESLTTGANPAFYQPLSQVPATPQYVAIRAVQDPALLIPPVRGAIREMDRQVPVDVAGTAEEIVASSLAQPRLAMLLMAAFAGLALALALIGIYGVMSYAVAQARREIGIRMALGAQRGDVLRLVFRYGAVVLTAGLATGAPAAVATGRLLASQLYEVKPADPLTFGAVVALTLGVGLIACLVPACRAMRVDPVETLRHE